jgi:hypothetical protein
MGKIKGSNILAGKVLNRVSKGKPQPTRFQLTKKGPNILE